MSISKEDVIDYLILNTDERSEILGAVGSQLEEEDDHEYVKKVMQVVTERKIPHFFIGSEHLSVGNFGEVREQFIHLMAQFGGEDKQENAQPLFQMVHDLAIAAAVTSITKFDKNNPFNNERVDDALSHLRRSGDLIRKLF